MELVKAKISKADINGPLMEQVCYVPFNPNEIKIDEACKVNSTDLHTSNTDVTKAEAERTHTSLSTTLYYNTYRSLNFPIYESVDLHINKLRAFLNENETATEKLKRIAFTWGDLCIYGILSSMSVRYMLFASDGTPIRAEVSITIEGSHYGKQKVSMENQATEFLLDSNLISGLSVMMGLADPSSWKDIARSLDLENPFS